MSHTYTKIWLHAVFSTKYRTPLLNSSIENLVYKHLREQLIEISCPVRIINGMPDHVHLLFLQNPKISVMDILKQIKGNTSNWINHDNLIPGKFSWQTGYAAFSVSESQIERVYQYIKNQKVHHKRKTFSQEYDEFIAAHGLLKEIEK